MNILTYNMFFFFNDTATTEIYTLSLHDALPISVDFRCEASDHPEVVLVAQHADQRAPRVRRIVLPQRSEEHTSELQSQSNIVCRLLLEKKKNPNLQVLSIISSRLSRAR